MLECPLYYSIGDNIQSLFEKVVEGNLKSYFLLNHQVQISFYLTDATIYATLGS